VGGGWEGGGVFSCIRGRGAGGGGGGGGRGGAVEDVAFSPCPWDQPLKG
jgi:hypothetical protein